MDTATQSIKQNEQKAAAEGAPTLMQRWGQWKRMYPNLGTYASLLSLTVVLIVIMTLASDQFLTRQNFINIITQSAYYLVLSVGMTLVLTTGGIDISIGSLVGLSSSVMGFMIIAYGQPVWLSILTGTLVGVLGGAFNGFFIVKFRVAPIIVTIGTFTMFRALAYQFTGGEIVFGLPPEVRWITQSGFLGLPVSVYIAFAVVAWGIFFLAKTRSGREISALGGNEKAAALAGLNVGWQKFKVYCIMGLLCALAGLITMARLGVGDPKAGTGYEFHVIAAVVLGGTAITGGRGLMVGSFIAVIFLQIANNGLYFSGISWFWQRVMIGTIFIVVVALRTFRTTQETH